MKTLIAFILGIFVGALLAGVAYDTARLERAYSPRQHADRSLQVVYQPAGTLHGCKATAVGDDYVNWLCRIE